MKIIKSAVSFMHPVPQLMVMDSRDMMTMKQLL